MRRKMNKGIRWNMRAVLTVLVGMVGVHCSVLLNAGPDDYPKPVLYELTDTVIYYGRAAQRGEKDSLPTIIFLPKLPVRGLSYREIVSRFGSDAIYFRLDEGPAYAFPYRWSRFPRIIAEKCKELDEKTIYRTDIYYRDGTGDVLVLWIYEEEGDIRILWGMRVNPTGFNLE